MDVLDAMQKDSGITIKELRVDGGATANNMLMQFQSDILHTKVIRPIITETTALGAAYLAGLAVGYWKSLDDISAQWQIEKVFEPAQTYDATNALIKGWKKAINGAAAATE
jgi:glycerol kinase